MRIAIIGTGISGLVSGYLLHRDHDVTLFEQNAYIGGHTNTVTVDDPSGPLAVDTGFIVFNDWTYPNFIQLLDQLGVESDPTSMSFSVQCERTGLEYNGTSLNGLFSQRRNLFNPRFHRMLLDIARFNRQAPQFLEDGDDATTVGEYLSENGYGQGFMEQYLLPMGAAIWSCPTGIFEQFPVKFIIEFYKNHGLLSVTNRPTWRVIRGGSNQYVHRLIEGFKDSIRLNCPIQSVWRTDNTVQVRTATGVEEFDEVVFACHSDQALAILDDPSSTESEVLGEFPYSRSTAILHTDETVLPKRRRSWAAWNYHLAEDRQDQATVTYNMNILQNLKTERTYCVTLNEEHRIEPSSVIRQIAYSHPIYTVARKQAQARHAELIRSNRTSFCGAYWANGFHEDGVSSALAVCEAFGRNLNSIHDGRRLSTEPVSV